jgi:hypothetical protein
MPTQKPLKRNYNMSDGELVQLADGMVTLVARDATDFLTRNVEDTDALTAARDSFANFPTDEELAADVSTAAVAKDARRAEMEDLADQIRNMAAEAFGERSTQYKAFGFAGLANMSDADAHRAALRIHRRADAAMTTLANEGLTAPRLTAFLTKVGQFDTAINAVEDAEALRDQKTQQRIGLGNTLFDEVSSIASVGKSLYVNTNEAKYNDYVIDPAGNGNNQPDPGEEEEPTP